MQPRQPPILEAPSSYSRVPSPSAQVPATGTRALSPSGLSPRWAACDLAAGLPHSAAWLIRTEVQECQETTGEGAGLTWVC
jgi:hypothetical protein